MIVVLGGSGYIGSKIVRRLAQRGDEVLSLSRQSCNYYDRDELASRLSRATFLINAAGYTGRPNVDACELHKADCLQGNAVLPGIVRDVCEAEGIPFVHVSSGCIFTGTRHDGSGFREEDPPNFCFRQGNCSFYSGTKALGEEMLEGSSNCYVLRLRIPFERTDNPRNYLSKILRYPRLLDATNSLTFLDDFIASCLHCIDERPAPGIYNIVNSSAVTTREVVERIRAYHVSDKSFEFFDSESQFMREAAKTPRSNCVLDNSKARRAGFPISDVRDALDHALANWTPETVSQ